MNRALALLLVACATPAVSEPRPVATTAVVPAATPPVSTWAEETRSPRSAEALTDPRAVQLLAACGDADGALARVAAIKGAPDDYEPFLREYGSPYVRPWFLGGIDGSAQERPMVEATNLLEGRHTAFTRCGIHVEGTRINVIAAEALADLDPLPLRSRTGAWLSFDATLRVPTSSAKVLVLGPSGPPKTYPTTMDPSRHARARFVLDQAGAFTVQLMADVKGEGPRPVAEALVFADVAPSHATTAAPGEHEPSLEAMVAATRKREGLPALKREPRLDALAAKHVERMQHAGRVAHDLGDGDFAQRFQAEGYAAAVVGENVARADTLALAHRKLYASPSHRLNLLNAQYTRFGVATLTEGARIWVCEVFSSDLR